MRWPLIMALTVALVAHGCGPIRSDEGLGGDGGADSGGDICFKSPDGTPCGAASACLNGRCQSGCGPNGTAPFCGSYENYSRGCCAADEDCCEIGFEYEECRPKGTCPVLVWCRGDWFNDLCDAPEMCTFTQSNGVPVGAPGGCLSHQSSGGIPPAQPTCTTGCTSPCAGPYGEAECCGAGAKCGDAGCCVLVNPPDAGPGGCNPFGGAGAGGLCLSTADCNCDGPDECVTAFFQGVPGTTGSCWPLAGATGCVGATDLALVADAGLPAHCFPTATLTGSFSVPISADGSVYGTASVTAKLNGVTLYGGQGGAYHDATDPAHPVVVVLIWAAGINTPPFAGLRIIIDQAEESTVAPIPLGLGARTRAHLTSGDYTSYDLSGAAYAGSIQLTEADWIIAGSFIDARLVGFTAELCGSHTTACQP
ncbi:MAG TPA: hypothetical protein VGQ83_33675 [Polyangia bacterium]|jgi:hypothetical protein